MRQIYLFAPAIALLFFSANVLAQHADVEFGYERDINSNPTGIEIEQDAVTTDGFQFFEAEFDLFGTDFFTDDPGFATHDGEGLLFDPGNDIWLEVLDASDNWSAFGVGYVNYYNPNTDSLEAFGRMRITDNAGGATSDLVLDGDSIESGVNPQFVQTAFEEEVNGQLDGNGHIHAHLNFDLLDETPDSVGAYGLLVRVQSDFDGGQDGDADMFSDAFWVIFNAGMDEEDFEAFALPRFGVAESIPEPSSMALIGFGAVALFVRRNRRNK